MYNHKQNLKGENVIYIFFGYLYILYMFKFLEIIVIHKDKSHIYVHSVQMLFSQSFCNFIQLNPNASCLYSNFHGGGILKLLPWN